MRLGTEWDCFAVHPKSFHGAGDSVIVEGRYSGTYKPTGRSMVVGTGVGLIVGSVAAFAARRKSSGDGRESVHGVE